MTRVPEDRDDETYGPMRTDDRADPRPLPGQAKTETDPMKPGELGKYVCVEPGGCLHSPAVRINADGVWVKTGQQWTSAHADCHEAHAQAAAKAASVRPAYTIDEARESGRDRGYAHANYIANAGGPDARPLDEVKAASMPGGLDAYRPCVHAFNDGFDAGMEEYQDEQDAADFGPAESERS